MVPNWVKLQLREGLLFFYYLKFLCGNNFYVKRVQIGTIFNSIYCASLMRSDVSFSMVTEKEMKVDSISQKDQVVGGLETLTMITKVL